MNRGMLGLSPPFSLVGVLRSCRSLWQSSFCSHSCLSSNYSCNSVLRQVRDPSTPLNCTSTAPQLHLNCNCYQVESVLDNRNMFFCLLLLPSQPIHMLQLSISHVLQLLALPIHLLHACSKAAMCSSSLLAALVAILC